MLTAKLKLPGELVELSIEPTTSSMHFSLLPVFPLPAPLRALE